jgi:hypothetical protein
VSIEELPSRQALVRHAVDACRVVAFVAVAFGLLTAPTADAQPTHKVWRVGFLGDGPRAERASISIEPFRVGLRELGYIENQNVVIEERWSDGRGELLLDLAAELVRLKVDVIITHGVCAEPRRLRARPKRFPSSWR